MKVAIDAQALGAQRGGDETYMRNLIRALATVDPDTDYTLFLAQPLSPQMQFPGLERMRRVVLRHHRLIRRIPVAMPLAMIRERVEVLHAQYVGPPYCPAPVVLSLHDIAYERYPQFFPRELLRHLRAIVPPAVRRAAVVLTLSEFSKRDIVQCYGVPPDKVVVAPCAADPIFGPMQDQAQLAAVRGRYGTGAPFILCVGNLEPRKNLGTLIAAYLRLRQADTVRHRLGNLEPRKNVGVVVKRGGYVGAAVRYGRVVARLADGHLHLCHEPLLAPLCGSLDTRYPHGPVGGTLRSRDLSLCPGRVP